MALIARLLQDLSEDERRAGETQVFVGHEFRQRTLRVRLESGLKSMGMEAYFADKHVTGEYVLDKICKKILVARASIVDLSHANPNVYFELGVAIGLNKPIFIVCQHDTSVPSLLESFVKLHFSSYASLEKDLAEKMPGWLQESIEHHLLYSTHCQFVSVLCPDRQRIAPTRSYLVIDELETQKEGQVVYGGDANFQAELPTALDRFQFVPTLLGAVPPQDTYRLCDYCRTLRAADFVLCHLTHQTSLNCYLLLGLAIGLGIPTLLLVRNLQDKDGKPPFELPRTLLGLDSFFFEDYVDISGQLGDAVEEFLVRYRSGSTRLQPLAFYEHDRRPNEGESLKNREEMETSFASTETPLPGEEVTAPQIIDITNQLPRDSEACIRRPVDAIRYIVINHTGVQPEVNAERVAQAQRARWPSIVGQYFITGDGEIQQTSPIDEVVTRDQEWIFQGINVYVAGNFDETIPSDVQLIALARLCRWLMSKHHLPEDAIRGVSEFIVTRSPGLQWREGQCWRDMLLNQIRNPGGLQLGDTRTSEVETGIAELAHETAQTPSTDDDAASTTTRAIRVLVVDPNPDWQETISSAMWRSYRTEVYTASSLPQALEFIAKARELDLVITELELSNSLLGPTYEGVTLIEKVRAAFPHVAIVVLTGGLRGPILEFRERFSISEVALKPKVSSQSSRERVTQELLEAIAELMTQVDVNAVANAGLTINAIRREAASATSLNETLSIILEHAARALSADSAVVHEYDQGNQEFTASIAFPDSLSLRLTRPRKNGISDIIARSRESVILEDVLSSDDLSHPVHVEMETKSFAGLRAKVGNEVVAVFFMHYKTPHHFSEAEKDFLGAISDLIAETIGADRERQTSDMRSRISAAHRLNTPDAQSAALVELAPQLTQLKNAEMLKDAMKLAASIQDAQHAYIALTAFVENLTATRDADGLNELVRIVLTVLESSAGRGILQSVSTAYAELGDQTRAAECLALAANEER